MYVLRTFRYKIQDQHHATHMVKEMTASEFRDATAFAKDGEMFERISSDRAKYLIFQVGYNHETGYWRDFDGKIRYAKAGF